jgi:hypothetical protein
MDNQGTVSRVAGVPAWYGRLAYGPESLYFIKHRVLMSLSAHDLAPRTEASLPEIAGPDAKGETAKGSVVGLLGPDDPLLRITYQDDDGNRVVRLHSLRHGPLPLSVEWTYVASPVARVLLAVDDKHRTLAAFSSTDLRPLWTHTFYEGRRPLTFEPPGFTPTGRKVVLPINSDGSHVVVLDAMTGQVQNRLRLPSSAVTFEDDSHFVYEAYDGPPNPGYDPQDPFPEVGEVDWPNLLIRCSLQNACELAARVDPSGQSLKTGDTFLFARR